MVCDMNVSKRSMIASGTSKQSRLALICPGSERQLPRIRLRSPHGRGRIVVIAPGLASDAAAKKAEQLRALAKQAGFDVCAEDMLSLSVGLAVSPEDGNDAEQLLTQADRRMYLEKQKQPSQKDQRLHTRMKCRLTIEMHPQPGNGPVFGNLIDISLGGCYVETSEILAPGSNVKLVFSIDDGTLSSEGIVARIHPGSGVGDPIQGDEPRLARKNVPHSGVRAELNHRLQRPLPAESLQALRISGQLSVASKPPSSY